MAKTRREIYADELYLKLSGENSEKQENRKKSKKEIMLEKERAELEKTYKKVEAQRDALDNEMDNLDERIEKIDELLNDLQYGEHNEGIDSIHDKVDKFRKEWDKATLVLDHKKRQKKYEQILKKYGLWVE